MSAGPNQFLNPVCTVGNGVGIAYGTTLADLNRDGKLDLVSASEGHVYMNLGNGDGTFQPWSELRNVHPTTVSIAVADLNGDGIPDLAAANALGIQILAGNGDGTFSSFAVVSVAGATYVQAVPLKPGGKPDLVVFSPAGMTIIPNNSAASLLSALMPAAAAPCTDVVSSAVADFNGDGLPDLAVGCVSEGKVVIYANSGNGKLTLKSTVSLPGVITALAAGDVNGDGFIDLVAAGGSDTVYLIPGSGSGTFKFSGSYTVNGGPEWVALADLRGIGRLDIVSAGLQETIDVLLNDGHGRFQNGVSYQFNSPVYWLSSYDFNRDGRPDLLVSIARGMQVLYGTGRASNSFVKGPAVATTQPVKNAVAGDLNHDGILDLVAFVPGLPSPIQVFLGQPNGSFRLTLSVSTGTVNGGDAPLALVDLNNDGNLDLVTSDIVVFLGHGDGTFGPPSVVSNSLMPVVVADFNRDGIPDLVAAQFVNGGLGPVNVYLGNGDGTFQAPLVNNTVPCQYVTVGDFNGDGLPDLLLTAAYADHRNNILLGNGDGTFRGSGVEIFPSLGWTYAMTGDFNGDGKVDVAAVAADFANVVYIALGNGDGTFQNAQFPIGFGTNGSPNSLVLGNFRNAGTPGKLDIVTGNGDGTLSVLFNTTP